MKNDIVKQNQEYFKLLDDLKRKIHKARLQSVLSVNKEMILLYWEIGNSILEKQSKEGWGTKVIDRLSTDLMKSFPEMKGFSARNLKYMRRFAETFHNIQFVQHLAAQIPWFHTCVLLDKVKEQKQRVWYMEQVIQNGWSRNVLVHQIETSLYKRQVESSKLTNFPTTLSKPQSELAQETFKDPYIFDFLTIDKKVREKEIEKRMKNKTILGQTLASKSYIVVEDPKIPMDKIPEFLDWLNAKEIPNYGHIGVGIIHGRVKRGYDLKEFYEKVQELGGDVSGEHGVGIMKMEYVSDELKERILRLKERYDPERILNEGKVI